MINRLLAILFLTLGLAKPAIGAEFSLWPCKDGSCDKASTILMAGPIVKGDYQKLYNILKENGSKIARVSIISTGGLVSESIEIGSMIRKLMLVTMTGRSISYLDKELSATLIYNRGNDYVCPAEATGKYPTKDCVCFSACFLIYSAGVSRVGNVIGLHRPTFVDAGFGNLDASTADRRYQELMKRVQNYLSEMGVNDIYFQKMMIVSSTEMYIVPADEAESNLAGQVPSLAEWLKSRCGELSSSDTDRLIDIRTRIDTGLPARDVEYNQLEALDNKINACRRSSMLAEREGRFKAFFSEKSSSSFWPFDFNR